MTEAIAIRLFNPQQAHAAITTQLWPTIKSMLMDGHRLELACKPEKRSSAENRLLHALIGEIAKQVEWAGAKREPEIWKRLLTAAWCREQGLSVEVLPALDGHGVDIVPVRTSKLTRGECADLITYVQAWAASHGVQVIDPETGEIL